MTTSTFGKIKWLIPIFVILPLAWIVTSLFARLAAPQSVFSPEGMRLSHQQDFAQLSYSQDFYSSASGQIDIITVSKPGSAEVILYFHGTGGRNIDHITQASTAGTVVSPAYPGYSQSPGSASETGVYETADAAMQFLKQKGYRESQVIVFGHSLGGVAALYTAVHYPGIKRLVLVNTFSSVYSMCWKNYSLFCLFTINYFNSARLAAQVSVPTEVFHDLNDNVIPYQEGVRLYESIRSVDKKFETLAGTHGSFDLIKILTK